MFWIAESFPGRIAILPRPRGGDWLEDEVKQWRRSGVDIVVSLLTNDEVADLALEREADACRANGIEFVSFPIVDRGLPKASREAIELSNGLAEQLAEGRNIGVHCRQGIGRSALVVAAILIASGLEQENALRTISAARGLPVPETPEQRKWVIENAEFLRAPLPT